MSRDGDNPGSIAHGKVLALTDNAKAGFSQGTHRVKMIDPGKHGHEQLDLDLNFAHVGLLLTGDLQDGFQILVDRVSDILQGLLFGVTL